MVRRHEYFLPPNWAKKTVQRARSSDGVVRHCVKRPTITEFPRFMKFVAPAMLPNAARIPRKYVHQRAIGMLWHYSNRNNCLHVSRNFEKAAELCSIRHGVVVAPPKFRD